MRMIAMICMSLYVFISVSVVYAEDRPSPLPQYDLSQLLSIALEHHPALALSDANVGASEGRLRGTKEYANPELSVSAGPGRVTTGPSNRGIEESIRVFQPVEWMPKRSARIRAAQEAVQGSAAQHQDVVRRVTASVSEAYFSLLGAQRELGLTSQTASTVQRLAETARKRVEAGEAPKFERIRAEVELQRVTKDVERARSRVAIGQAGLDAEVGGALGKQFEVIGDFPEGNINWDLAEVMKAADRHPSLLAREREEAERQEQLRVARTSRVPDVAVFGTFEREIDRESYRAGLTIPLPIWSQRQGAIAEATAGARRATAQVHQTKVELRKDVIHAFEQYRIAKSQLELFRKGLLRQAEEAAEIARKSYRVGEVSLLELFEAQRVALQVTREYYQAQVDLALAITTLERLTGGIP